MGLREVERRIERGVEGVVGRIFRSAVSRVELTKRLERELDSSVRRGRVGPRVMPNDIQIRLNPRDLSRMGAASAVVERELVRCARTHARREECGFDGPLVVRIDAVEAVPVGTIEIEAVSETSVAGIVPGTVIGPGGARIDLTELGGGPVVLGRDAAADIVIDDELASRTHARLRATTRGWVLEDLDSTNGTRVNGFRTKTQLLSDGDHITIGASTFDFDAS